MIPFITRNLVELVHHFWINSHVYMGLFRANAGSIHISVYILVR
jgi:hypothetical protein